MNNESGTNSTLFGTVGGTLLSVSANIHPGDVVKTVVLAIVGAMTSFAISLGLKWIRKKVLEFKP